MNQAITIMWFRQDLRITDNPALVHAVSKGRILPIYILDEPSSTHEQIGAASRVWLHQALENLNSSLNGHLQVFSGDALDVIRDLIKENDICAISWNRCYEPWRMQRDAAIKTELLSIGVDVKSFNGSLLWEPWNILKGDGTHYKVFTPYYRRGCLSAAEPRLPTETLTQIDTVQPEYGGSLVSDILPLPDLPWSDEVTSCWQCDEQTASASLDTFLEQGISDYKDGRNFPAKKNVSRLSPYFHYGVMSPNQAWYRAQQACAGLPDTTQLDVFCSELGWREFSYYLLYHFNALPVENWSKKFNMFPWQTDQAKIKAWQTGQTGYPIIDAGMRELWQTGYMHNRVRMVVGSFLVKNLRQHWHHGRDWFWDCLVDADLAANSASWQWIAGCGADAAPYFRVFNPVTQGQKFDKQGEYVSQYCPELANLPEKYIHTPWLAPEDVLNDAGVELGVNYPQPIVDLALSRKDALAAYTQLKEALEQIAATE